MSRRKAVPWRVYCSSEENHDHLIRKNLAFFSLKHMFLPQNLPKDSTLQNTTNTHFIFQIIEKLFSSKQEGRVGGGPAQIARARNVDKFRGGRSKLQVMMASNYR